MQTYMAARVFVWTNGIVVVVKVVFFYCRRPPHFSDAASTLDEIRQTLSDSSIPRIPNCLIHPRIWESFLLLLGLLTVISVTF